MISGEETKEMMVGRLVADRALQPKGKLLDLGFRSTSCVNCRYVFRLYPDENSYTCRCEYFAANGINSEAQLFQGRS